MMISHLKMNLIYGGLSVLCIGLLSMANTREVASENSFDRIQAGQWVTASMYWQDKVVASGKPFNPLGWHAAHRTLPMGTLIRVSNPKNHRSINITINDRGPFVPDRVRDLSLGAGALLGFSGLGTVYMEVLAYPPVRRSRPIVENLFAVNDANGNCSATAC